ncbi:MAG: hypothetical protein ACOX2P_04055 [Bacillota bacterium]|jgi:hypothetical protein
MDKTNIITMAGIATLASLPLLYFGVNGNTSMLWLGIAVFTASLIIPIILRFSGRG